MTRPSRRSSATTPAKPGVRNLQRTVGSICRKVAKEITQKKPPRDLVTPEMVVELLGPKKFHNEVAAENDRIGVVTGMAWTETGGDILFVEATSMPGKAELILTGSLGDVMKESARAALSYIEAHADEFGISRRPSRTGPSTSTSPRAPSPRTAPRPASPWSRRWFRS